MKKKVLIINSGPKPLPPVEGGGVESLIQFMIEDCPEDVDMTVACIKSEKALKESLKYPKVSFVFLDFNDRLYKIQLYFYYFFNHFLGIDIGNALCNLVKRNIDLNDFDVIISENGVRLGKSLKNIARGKVVLHLHNDWLNENTRFASLYKESYDEIWAISKFLKGRIDQIPGNTRVRVLYNGVDQTKFFPQTEETKRKTRAEMNIKYDDIVLANCCRIVEEKGVLETIQVFTKIQQAIPDKKFKLLIIGNISDKDEYQKLVKEVSNKDVIFTGYVSHSNVARIMGCADVGISSTIHKRKYYKHGIYNGVIECFNLTVVEYLSLGIPVICTDSGGMREIIEQDFPSNIVSADEDKFAANLFYVLKNIHHSKEVWGKDKMLEVAHKFSKSVFIDTFTKYVDEL